MSQRRRRRHRQPAGTSSSRRGARAARPAGAQGHRPARDASRGGEETPPRRPVILIVDDEEVVRHFLREALQGAGFETIEARHGVEALDRYRTSPADLVITDIVMPEAGGQEVLLELTWETPPAKVVAISGQGGDPTFLSMARRFGACRTLMKPFKRAQLIGTVTEVLQEPRRHVRLDVHFPVGFALGGQEGQGSVINLSRAGCAVESDAPIPAGTYLTAHFFPPGEPAAFAVKLAVVRWSSATAFGLEFIRMAPDAQDVLRRVLIRLGRAA